MGKDKLFFRKKTCGGKKCENILVSTIHLAIGNINCVVDLNNVSETKKRIINSIFWVYISPIAFF